MTTTVVLDVETTGLDPARHQIWEIALIVEGHRRPGMDGEWLWQTRPDLSAADAAALRISRYYERNRLSFDSRCLSAPPAEDGEKRFGSTTRPEIATHLAVICDRATLYGAVPSFDAMFLERFLRRHGQAPTWDHRLRCVESMTAGHLGTHVGGLRDCADRLDIDYNPADLHSALDDARLAAAIRDELLRDDEDEVDR